MIIRDITICLDASSKIDHQGRLPNLQKINADSLVLHTVGQWMGVESMKVGVIGGGPAGLTAAYELAKGGVEVELFEAGPAAGGMCRSFELWGQIVDLGPHRFFSSDPRVNRLWLEVIERDYRMVDRFTRIFYGSRFFQYPLQPTNALQNLGPWEAARCITSYLRQKVGSDLTGSSFETWVVNRFGRRLFEIFFKTYSEKLWGISCQDLDADFAAQRIKKLSLGEVAKNALGLGRGRHQTLVDQFAYPVGGTGMVYDRMAEYVGSLGELHLNRPVAGVLHDQQRVTGLRFPDGTTRDYDHVISTMPLTLMVKGLEGTPDHVHAAAASLKFRNTILVYLRVNGSDLFPDQWIYVHAPELLVGRVTNFRNWVPEICANAPETILSLEYWADDEDAMWREDDEQLIARATAEIQATGLIGEAPVEAGHVVRVPRCYPVYARGYKEHLAVVAQYLDQFQGLTPIGRYGSFKYNNQDHSILMGLLAAQNLIEQSSNNLWSINTDYDTYQEATTITAAGLVSVGAGSA
jgi:protoporphyrinogen oxidase